MSAFIYKKKKGELQELAQQANLPDWEGLLKDDLATKLDDYLAKNESKYGKNATFKDYYARTASPVKRERPTPTDDTTIAVKKPRGRRQTIGVEQDESPEDTPVKTLVKRTPRTVSRIVSQNIDALPASPAQIANYSEQKFTAAGKKASEIWQKSKIEEGIEFLREFFSSVVTVQASVLLLEAGGLQWTNLKTVHLANTPKVGSYDPQSIYVPDARLLLTGGFWAPAALWSLTSLFLPLIASYFFNLTLRSNTRHKSSKSSYAADPLTFNIAKALLAWIVYSKDGSWGPFNATTVETVGSSVPGELTGLYIGAGVGILATLYDAALKK